MSLQPPLDLSTIDLPDSLRPQIINYWQQWHEQLNKNNFDIEFSNDIKSSLTKVWASSLFVAESCIRQPKILLDLVASEDLLVTYTSLSYSDRLTALTAINESELMTQLRFFRRREMVRIAWRDLSGWAPLEETLLELSWLAEACIQKALAFLYEDACTKKGTPLLANGNPQQIIVLGMGKLGAYELNYSSDIDLIFAYPENGVLTDRKKTSYCEFFTRLCQSLVKVLDEITVDGFVFRTDIRLRPFGDSGAIIMSFEGMEHYYLTQAREWERYAMIKARQVAGDFTAGAELMAMLHAFVYRRYLDYGAFNELRSIKYQICHELLRKDRLDNIKLGIGGIREVEFIGHGFQLIRGGADKSLQTRSLMTVLQRLGELNLLNQNDVTSLISSYVFLRRVENHIQQYQDKQTHDLPTADLARISLSYSMEFSDWSHFKATLDEVRQNVHKIFDDVVSRSANEAINPEGWQIWMDTLTSDELINQLEKYSFNDPETTLFALKQFKQSSAIRRLSSKSTEILDRLIPLLLTHLKSLPNPDITLERILNLLEAIASRSVYLSLLVENPDALAQLLRLASLSPWICENLSSYPILLDDLLDHRSLFSPLQRDLLDVQLTILLKHVESQDLEQLMIVLRQFKQQQVLKVAATDIMGVIPLMVVSDYLTYIAESILSQAFERAWLILTAKHGTPPDCDAQSTGFAILGFGKLGGIELSYSSDLDLVFICDYANGQALTNGDKPIPCTQFYARLGQKIRHILDTRLLSGILYEVDMRLRPSGDSGLLVTPISSYEIYLQQNAWTWEHQALVRSRFIAGDRRLKVRYQTIKLKVLCSARSYETLKAEVREMREKMRLTLEKKIKGKFDLKQGKGGITDIEFIVQFMVLAYAEHYPSLVIYSDNIRLLENLTANNLLPENLTNTLKTAYCFYRDLGHKLTLQGYPTLVDDSQVMQKKSGVGKIWHDLMIK